MAKALLALFAGAADVYANSYASPFLPSTRRKRARGWTVPLPPDRRMDRERFRVEGRRLCAEAVNILTAAGWAR